MVSKAAIFRGDGEGLVDMLIAASQAKPVPTPSLAALAGRELVPWQAEEMPCPAGASPQLMDMPLEARHSKFPARQARAQQPSAAAAAAAANRVMAAQRGIPRVGSGRRLSADQAPAAGFACPAVAASPKPEALPMPTGLMSRVARSRSPSPPKDSFMAVSMMAHVRPVAA